MALVDELKKLDNKYDQINEMWAEEIKKLCLNEKIKPNSRKFEKMVAQINKKYANMAADVLVDRDEVYVALVKQQNEEYFAQFSDPERETPAAMVDENGRPIGKKWVDGHWVDVDVKK